MNMVNIEGITIIKNISRDTQGSSYINTKGDYMTITDIDTNVHSTMLDLMGIDDEYEFLLKNGWIKISMNMTYDLKGMINIPMNQSQMDTLKKFYDANGIKKFQYNYKWVEVELLSILTPTDFVDYINGNF